LGQVKPIKIIILIACLVVVSVFVYFKPLSKEVTRHVSLSEGLSVINGWHGSKSIIIDQRIVNLLKLDDYVNRYYTKDDKSVLLYVGYYFSSQKVGAVHDPLVCFPGQGWIVSTEGKRKLRIGDNSLNIASMVVTKGQRKQIVFYWFQAFDKTSPNTFHQKIYSLWAKFVKGKEDNAFVRITVALNNQSIEEASRIGINFIEAFYPQFLKFVKSGT